MKIKHYKLPETEIATATITDITHDGRGVAHVQGKATFITGALPNETVQFVYTTRRGKFDEGKIHKVLSPSEQRAEPNCPHFSVCGGCALQHINSDAQLAMKQKLLLDQLQHIGGLQPKNILPPLRGSIWGYRHKARLGVKYVAKKEKLLVGFREKNNRYLADIERCEILHPSVGLKISELKSLIASLNIYQQVAQIEIAVSDKITALIFRHMVNKIV